MKKLFASLLACLYLGLACGAGVELHHCMGRVAGGNVTLGSGLASTESGDHHCPHCGMVKSDGQKKGCCKDESKTFQADDAVPVAAKVLVYAPDFAPALPARQFFWTPRPAPTQALAIKGFQPHAPPEDGDGVPRFLRLCCFLI